MSECEKIRPRLAAFLDGEVEDPGKIQAHLDSCPSCRSLLDSHRKVVRLSSVVPDIEPGANAWNGVEARLTLPSNRRMRTFMPAVAAACIAVVVYIFLFSGTSGRQPVGSLTRKTGLVRIKPLAGNDWIEQGKKHEIYGGDSIKTGSDGAALLELMEDGGFILLDCMSELSVEDLQNIKDSEKTLPVKLLSGRICVCSRDCLISLNAEGASMRGYSQCVVEIENGNPAVYVKSGNVKCCVGDISAEIQAMQKLILDNKEQLIPSEIVDDKIFDWVNKLLD